MILNPFVSFATVLNTLAYLPETFSPRNSNVAADIGSIMFGFTEAISKGASGNITIRTVSGQVTLLQVAVTDASVTVSNATVTVANVPAMAGNTQYEVIVDAGAFVGQSSNNSPALAAGTWLFTTAVAEYAPLTIGYQQNAQITSEGVITMIDTSNGAVSNNNGILSADTFDLSQPFEARVTWLADPTTGGVKDMTFGIKDQATTTVNYGNYNAGFGIGMFNGLMNRRYAAPDVNQTSDVNAVSIAVNDVIELKWDPSSGSFGAYDVLVNDTSIFVGGPIQLTAAPASNGKFQIMIQGEEGSAKVELKASGAGGAVLPPVASLSFTRNNLAVDFDASASVPRLGATITNYEIDFGDGSSVYSDAADATTSHTYSTSGTYYAVCTITDSNGNKDVQVEAIVATDGNIDPQWSQLRTNMLPNFQLYTPVRMDSRSAATIRGLLQPDGSFSDNAFSSCGNQVDHITAALTLAWDFYNGGSTTSDQVYDSFNYWLDNENIPYSGSCDWTEGLRVFRYLGYACYCMDTHNVANRATDTKAQDFFDKVAAKAPRIWEVFRNNSLDNNRAANNSSRVRGAMYVALFLRNADQMERAMREVYISFEPGQGVGLQSGEFTNEYWIGVGVFYSFFQHNNFGGQFLWGNYGTVAYDEARLYLAFIENTIWRINTFLANILHKAATDGLIWTFVNSKDNQGAISSRLCKGRTNLDKRTRAESLNFVFRSGASGMGSLTTASGFTQQQLDDFDALAVSAGGDTLVTEKVGTKYFPDGGWFARYNMGAGIADADSYVIWYKITGLVYDSLEQGIYAEVYNYDMGYGQLELMRHNADEFEALPVMDMEHWPGVTSLHTGNYNYGANTSGKTTEAATGPTTSDNKYAGGLAEHPHAALGFQLSRNHPVSTPTGNKSFFSFSDLLVMMGTNIDVKSAGSDPVYTGVIKSKILSDIYYDVGAGEVTVSNGTYPGQSDFAITGNAWFYHQNTGFIIVPNGTVNLKLWIEQSSGDWRNLSEYNGNEVVTEQKIELVIDHGNAPGGDDYLVIVTLDKTKAEVAALAASLPIEVASQTDDIHAVYHTADDVLAAVHYTASGSVTFDTDKTLAVNQPCTLLLKGNGANWDGFVSDPQYLTDQAISSVTVTVQGNDNLVNLSTEKLNLSDPAGDKKTFTTSKS